MALRPLIKGLLWKTAFYSGASHLSHRMLRQPGCIIGLHRVVPKDQLAKLGNADIELSVGFFEGFLQSVLDKNFTFVSLDEALLRLESGDPTGKFLTIGFDDGYIDNATVVYPLLKKYSIPFTIYVTTDFPDFRTELWWYQLEDLLMKKATVRGHSCSSLPDKARAFMLLRNELMALDRAGRAAFFEKETGRDYDESCGYYASRMCMSWADLLEIARDPLVTIGAHSLSHPALAMIDEAEAFREMNKSREILEARLNQPIHHFAYPFGGVSEASEREFSLASKLGFRSAVTTREGNLPRGVPNLMALPRILLGEDQSYTKFWVQKSGLKSWFGQPALVGTTH